MSRLLKIAVGIAVGLVLVLVGIALVGTWQVAGVAREKMEQVQAGLATDWKNFEPQVLADEARWKNDPLLTPHPGGDAANVLFAHLRWDKDNAPPPLPTELTEALRTAGSEWAKKADAFDVSAIDSRWMAELGAFGFWDLEGEGSRVEKQPFALLSEPIPEFTDLQVQAKVHLLAGLKAGSAVQAGKDVRELARLCLSSETLIGEMVGTALLGTERHGFEAAVERGQDVTGWSPISEADQKSLTRLLWAAQAPSTLLAIGALSTWRVAVGECAAMREGFGQAFFLRGYLQDQLPERYASMGTTLESSGCRLRRLRLAWKNPEPSAGQLPVKGSALCMQEPGIEASECAVPDGAILFPFARAFIGDNLVTLATPDWFKKYRDLAAAPQ